MFSKKISVLLICVFCLTVLFSACKKDSDSNTSTGDYVYQSEAGGDNSDNTPASEKIKINTGWKKNYSVSYNYFNKEQENAEFSATEKRSDNYFSAQDDGSGSTLYYAVNGSDIDSYVIVSGEKEVVHSKISGVNLNELSSAFMKLSEVDDDLPSRSNVLYMYEESVAGRTCNKYIQRAYSDGKVTDTVYVWVDAEYGFAAKGEIYDANDSLTASWEITSFSVGNIEDKDVKLDLSDYDITED